MSNVAASLLVGALLVTSCRAVGLIDTAEPVRVTTRDQLIAGYTSVLSAHDVDGDGMLSSVEIQAMVDLAFPRSEPVADNSGEARSWVLAFYDSQDQNHDGELSLAELLAAPLATFECMDVNGDQVLSRSEIDTAMGHCSSDRRVGFISEPHTPRTQSQ